MGHHPRAGVADRLGGLDALRRSGAFHEVEPLARGGVWCLAATEYAQFDDEALLKVFRALASVLRPDTPRRFEKPRDVPFGVVYRDAADPGNSAPSAPPEIKPPVGKLVPEWATGRRLGGE